VIYGTSHSAVDVASGQIQFYGKSAGGSVTFMDNNGLLSPTSTANSIVGATIAGFQAGDAISIGGLRLTVRSLQYNASSHVLSVNNGDSSIAAQFTLAGAIGDFQLVSPDGGARGWTITTTSKANAVPAFSIQDTVTQAAGSSAGQQYAGPVNYLQTQ